jgi:hypothetical protein
VSPFIAFDGGGLAYPRCDSDVPKGGGDADTDGAWTGDIFVLVGGGVKLLISAAPLLLRNANDDD